MCRSGALDDPVASIGRVIAARLPRGHPKIDRVAAARGTTVRTLQRRLAESGLTYRRLVDEVRFERACRLLGDSGTRLSDIAAALGYAHPAHFTRAFTRWTGMTPRAYRRRVASNSSVPSRAKALRSC